MEQVQELKDQELPLEEQELGQAEALVEAEVQALLGQARVQLQALEAQVRVLAALLVQAQVAVQELVEGLLQEEELAQVEEAQELVVSVFPLAQAQPQAVGLEQALGQELVEVEDLQALPLLSLYQLPKEQQMILGLLYWNLIGLILGMVMGLLVSLILLKDSGNLWLWESRKVERLEKELAQAKEKLREQHLALGWDLQQAQCHCNTMCFQVRWY